MEMVKRKRKPWSKSKRTIFKEKLVSFIILLIVSIIWIIPVIYMIGVSFKTPEDFIGHPELLFPSNWNAWTIEHYSGFLIRDGKIDAMPIWMLNSLWSTFANVFISLIFDLVVAYAFVFLNFKGKKILINFLVLWMTVPGVLGTASSYAIYANFRELLNIQSEAGSYLYIYFWLIVPGSTGIFNLLLMRNLFASIPIDIIDSARSDGASNRTIFFKIVMPLAKSTIMLIVLFGFTGAWNNLAWPQLLLSGQSKFFNTVTVALTGYTGSDSAWSATSVAMATSVFSLIPIMIVFICTQNKMIDGVASTGVKR